jgi:hypothetical protein
MPRFNLADILRNTKQVGECLVWQKAKSKAGYGQVWDGSKVIYTHRLVAELIGLELSAGLDVMHSCDVRGCCNPTHLSVGTRKENMVDASNKGRLLNKAHVEGQSHPSAKLSTNEIAELRAMRNRGAKLKHLSEIYGVSIAAISKITRGETRVNG